MTGLSCKSREDIALLAEGLRYSNNPAGVASVMMATGMMKMQWWAHALVRFMCWRHDISPQQAWGIVFAKFPVMAGELIEAAATWIVAGKDKDGEGIGGFNQRECDVLAYTLMQQIKRDGVAQ